jgi:hypothetical protein
MKRFSFPFQNQDWTALVDGNTVLAFTGPNGQAEPRHLTTALLDAYEEELERDQAHEAMLAEWDRYADEDPAYFFNYFL